MAILPQYVATTMTTIGERVSSTSPLFFELNTDPDPVRVSPSTGDPQRADFVLIGSRRSNLPIECREITVTIPTGNNSPDLTSDINSISPQISLLNWSPRTDANARTIVFTPTAGPTVIGRDQGVTIQLMGMRINTVVGSAPLRIAMAWRESFEGNETEPWDTGITTFNVGKFPASFRLDNFKAEQLIVDNGDSVKLNWEASGASSLGLLYDTAEINVLAKSTYTVHNLAHTTVFYLRGTIQVGNNSVTRTLTTTVTVRNQDLEVGNLRVHGDLFMVTNTPGTPIPVGRDPRMIAITPDGKTAYITNNNSDSVTPLDVATNTPGTPIPVGRDPRMIAITPDGKTAYTTDNNSDSVTPLDVATNTPGTPIPVGRGPYQIAITPDGKTAYITKNISNSVTPLDVATNTPGTPIPVGLGYGIAITPDGKTAYITNNNSNSVTPLDVATNTPGTPIPVGRGPFGIAITPDGKTAYITDNTSDSVTPLDVATNTPGTPIPVGRGPFGIAITPDGKTAYITNSRSDSVTPLDVATNTPGTPIPVGRGYGIAITPDGKTAYITNSGSNSVTPIRIWSAVKFPP